MDACVKKFGVYKLNSYSMVSCRRRKNKTGNELTISGDVEDQKNGME